MKNIKRNIIPFFFFFYKKTPQNKPKKPMKDIWKVLKSHAPPKTFTSFHTQSGFIPFCERLREASGKWTETNGEKYAGLLNWQEHFFLFIIIIIFF